MTILCRIGLHRYRGFTHYYPSINAPIVERYESGAKCARCGKMKDYAQYRWDEQDFIRISER